jgi:hypothetical protein
VWQYAEMKEQKTMSKLEIASKIKAGKDFYVGSKDERKLVLTLAPFQERKLTTRADGDKFKVIFL